jgi:cytochrome c553
LAATCAACHGTDGNAVRGAPIPRLAGLPQDYIVRQMRGFRDGSLTATVMQQIAKGFSEGQIAELAAYFAQRPDTP